MYKMGKGEIENWERRKDILGDDRAIKLLFIRIIERSLQDLTGEKLILCTNKVSYNQKKYLSASAMAFLKSDWCQEMCSYIGIDHRAIMDAAKRMKQDDKQLASALHIRNQK
jgi:hypothetical protein